MSAKTEMVSIETLQVISRTCDRCGAETLVKSVNYGPTMAPQEQSNCVHFSMNQGSAFPIDSMFFDLSGDLCESCVASFVEWFNAADGPGWEKGKTWEQIKNESWAL